MFKLRKPLAPTLLAAAILCAGCFKSENVVTKVKPDGDMRLDGVTYALPRTVVQVRIPFKSIDAKPGLYERYAPCFFPKSIADERVRVEKTTFSMEQPTFSSSGEPDPDEHYIARIKGGYFENKTMFLEFNSDGIITKGEASSENKAIDFAIKTARTAISVAAGGFTPRTERAGGDEAFDRKVREAEVNICRSVVVTDAAAAAVASATAAAKAARKVVPPATPDDKTPAEVMAEEAGTLVKTAELKIAAARKKEQNRIDRQTEPSSPSRSTPGPGVEGANPAVEQMKPGNDGKNTEEMVGGTSSHLLDDVINLAEQVRGKVKEVAQAAKPAAGALETGDTKAAAEAAKAAEEAAKGIASTIKLVGSNKDNDDAEAFANEFELARKVNKRIEELRENREDLTSGVRLPTNLSADAIKLLIEQAEATITKLERTYFLGTKDSDTWTGDFRFVPVKADPSGVNAVQTSQMLIVQTKGGLCPTVESNRQEIKIKPSFVAKDCPDPSYPDGLLKGGEGVWVRVSRVRDNDGFLNGMAVANARDEQRGKRGFYYRIPAAAIVTLFKSKTLPGDGFKPEAKNVAARENMKVAQLGVTASLPASSSGRTTQYTIDFNEATGAMKNFKLASNALLEASLAEEAGGAVTDVITAKKARDAAAEAEAKAAADAAAAASDELNQMKQLLEKLKTENAINEELKKKAASPQPTPEP
ncbi:MAG: DUF4831 family protein [Pyrinomonadaceae bacterium]